MFTRIVTFTGASDIDAGVRYLQDTAAPLLHGQNGFRGVTASADRSGAVLSVLSLWATEADRDASESSVIKARDEGQRVTGGDFAVERFEELLLEVRAPRQRAAQRGVTFGEENKREIVFLDLP
ncbi:MAG TPA: hypothetical protein VN767_18690 [Streptosporangiaceae bacterium]|jgi:hypothetical protein|nr:hypothetical protein [Streptosporangiaceae bacterium]